MDAMTLQPSQTLDTIEEDLGSALQRSLPPQLSDITPTPNEVTPEIENLNITSDLMVAPTSKFIQVFESVFLTAPIVPSMQTTIERKTVVMTPGTKTPANKRKGADEKASKPKKKKKRDEIDDIFGF